MGPTRTLMHTRVAERVAKSGNCIAALSRDIAAIMDGAIRPEPFGIALHMARKYIANDPAINSVDVICMANTDEIDLMRITPRGHRRIARLMDRRGNPWTR